MNMTNQVYMYVIGLKKSNNALLKCKYLNKYLKLLLTYFFRTVFDLWPVETSE